MTIGVRTFQGARLREARLSRGLFKNALGDLIGVSGTAIARYEDGLDSPQAERLDAIANKLNFPMQFFLRPAWPEAIDRVHWRSRTTETKSAREMTEQRMRWLCEIFAFLEDDLEFPRFELPAVDLPDDFRLITPAVMQRAATALRTSWGLRNQPIPNMVLALENVGIVVSTIEIPSEKQDGFCFVSKRLERPFVGINTANVSCARARFDAAHELGHLVLHRNVPAEQTRDPASHKLLELQANYFAGELLFPKEAFLSECQAVSVDYFASLKRRWGMSIAAMIMRAHDLQLIGKEEKVLLYRSLTNRGWRGPLREPFDAPSEMPLERPRMLRRGMEVALSSGVFGKAALLAALPIPPPELERLAGLDHGFLSITEIHPAIALRPRRLSAVDVETGSVIDFPGVRKN